jgi:hypothetical protein
MKSATYEGDEPPDIACCNQAGVLENCLYSRWWLTPTKSDDLWPSWSSRIGLDTMVHDIQYLDGPWS